jgi:uncharacterized membrane protein YcaP (DUF421 family)
MNFGGYFQIILSSVTVYLFIVVAIRLFGKKELAQLSVIDLVFILLISNAVQNAMVGSDSSLLGGLIAASALFVTNFILKAFVYKSRAFSKLIQGEPILLIYKGKINHKNVERAKLTMDEIHEAVREHGMLTIDQVDLAVLEIDGSISVLSDEYRRKSIKQRKIPKADLSDH